MRKFNLVALLFLAMIQFSTAQNDTVRLAVGPQTIGCQPGSTITVPVTMADGANITGCQFSLAWDVTKLQVVAGSPTLVAPFDNPLFPALTFGTDSLANGKLRLAWASISGVTVGAATPIFTVKFNVLQASNSTISIVNTPTPIAVGSGISPVVPQKWTVSSGLISTGDAISPVVTCPADTIIGGINPLIVNDLNPVAFDNCSLQSVSYQLSGATSASGFGDVSGQEVFNLGTTFLTYTATDGSGNSATCQSLVSIGPDTLTVRVESAAPDCGEAFFVDVVVDNFEDVVTLGFTIEWDESLLKFDSTGLLEGQFIGIDPTDLGEYQISNGKLTFAWFDAVNHSAPNGTRLFRIYFTNLGGSGAFSSIIFSSSPTPQLAGSGVPAPFQIPVIWESGSVLTTDVISPTIFCHADSSVFSLLPNQVPFPISGLFPTVTDNCIIDSIAYQLTGATLGEGEMQPTTELDFNFGTTIVTQIVWDASGNSDTCSFEVSLFPAIEPEFYLPTIAVNCGIQKAFFEVTVKEFTDIEQMGFIIGYDDNIIEIDSIHYHAAFNPPVNWFTIIANSQIQIGWTVSPGPALSVADHTPVIRVYFSVLGQVGDISPLVFNGPIEIAGLGGFQTTGIGFDGELQVIDFFAPQISDCPFSFTVPADSSCQATVTWTEPTAIDLCDQSNILFTSNFSSGSIFGLGTTTVTYTAIDFSQNQSECSFSVTVEDQTKPFIECPANVTLTVNVDCELIINDLPLPDSIFDNCSALANLNLTSNFSGPDTLQAGDDQIYIFTISDEKGNSNQCSFSISAEPASPPAIDFCPNSQSVSCDTASLFELPIPTFSGGCGPLGFSVSPADTSSFPMGNTTVIFKAFSGTDTTVCQFVVNVFDNQPPVISLCSKDTTVTAASGCVAPMPAFAVEASDNCDPNFTIESTPAVPGDQLAAGEHTITISVTDASGNSATCTYTITVNSAGNASFFNCPPDQVYMDTCAVVATWQDPIPTGFCGLPVIFESNPLNFVNVFAGLPDTIFYTAMDGAGNSATCSFIITVMDTVKPTLDCPGDIVIDIAGNVLIDPDNYITNTDTVSDCMSVQVFFGIPPADDDCSSTQLNQNIGPTSGQFFLLDSTTMINWRAFDASGNFATCAINITVVGLDTPTISGLPNPACPNGLVTLMTDSPAGSQFVWTGPQGFTTTNDSAFIFGITASTAGPYTVETSVNGCPAPESAPFSVILAQKPVAVNDIYNVEIGTVLDSFDVFLNDLKTAGDTYQVTLMTPLGGLDNLGQGLFTFTVPGTAVGNVFFQYAICSATCPTLCDTALVTINVQNSTADCAIIPKVITPNGDGSNDYWYIFCLDSGLFDNNELVVYNQWGDKVYEAAPYKNDWRGTLFGENGRYLPDGTYFYIFKPSPTDSAIKGFLTIFK